MQHIHKKIQEIDSDQTPQGTDQWKYDRIGYLTGSKFSTYFYKATKKVNWGNVIPILEARKTKMNFERNGWLQDAIVDQFYSKQEIKEFIWGHTFEPVARELINPDMTVRSFVKSDKYELLGCSPDGEEKDLLHEIKCPFKIGNFGLIRMFGVSKDFKPEWYWQTLCNAYVCDKSKALLSVFDPRLVDDTNPNQPKSEYLYQQEIDVTTSDILFIEKILKEITVEYRRLYPELQGVKF